VRSVMRCVLARRLRIGWLGEASGSAILFAGLMAGFGGDLLP
jgi:hypothetical protein